MLHGGGGRKEDILLTAERLCAVSFRCLLPDLLAHGDNPGVSDAHHGSVLVTPMPVFSEKAAWFIGWLDPAPAAPMQAPLVRS